MQKIMKTTKKHYHEFAEDPRYVILRKSRYPVWGSSRGIDGKVGLVPWIIQRAQTPSWSML